MRGRGRGRGKSRGKSTPLRTSERKTRGRSSSKTPKKQKSETDDQDNLVENEIEETKDNFRIPKPKQWKKELLQEIILQLKPNSPIEFDKQRLVGTNFSNLILKNPQQRKDFIQNLSSEAKFIIMNLFPDHDINNAKNEYFKNTKNDEAEEEEEEEVKKRINSRKENG